MIVEVEDDLQGFQESPNLTQEAGISGRKGTLPATVIQKPKAVFGFPIPG